MITFYQSSSCEILTSINGVWRLLPLEKVIWLVFPMPADAQYLKFYPDITSRHLEQGNLKCGVLKGI